MKTKEPETRSAKAEDRSGLPKIVSATEWRKASEKLLAKEKTATHARDALAAERRRLPMVKIDKSYVFSSPGGKVRLLDLFEGRRQLLLYHFMFAPGVDGWPTAGCPGCSMFVDQVGHLAHLHARDTSFYLVSRAPLAKIQRYTKRMGWSIPWVSSADSDFNVDFGVTTKEGETFGLSVFLRDGVDIYRSYFTSGRGVEALGSVWTFSTSLHSGGRESGRIRRRAGRKLRRTSGGAATMSTPTILKRTAHDALIGSKKRPAGQARHFVVQELLLVRHSIDTNQLQQHTIVHPNPSCPVYSPPPASLVMSFTSYFSINLPVSLNTLAFKLIQRSAISLASASCP